MNTKLASRLLILTSFTIAQEIEQIPAERLTKHSRAKVTEPSLTG